MRIQLTEPSVVDKLLWGFVYTVAVVLWLIVLGCGLFGLIVSLWREIK
jgi:formate-dependent nitrite reductase membrane component NrfD